MLHTTGILLHTYDKRIVRGKRHAFGTYGKILFITRMLSRNKRKILAKDMFFNLLPDDKNLDWSKLKQIADDILKCI